MSELLEKLAPNQRRGSKPRCHWITQGEREQVAARLTTLIAPWGQVTAEDRWMPKGFDDINEAELHTATALLDQQVCHQLREWWFAILAGQQKSPNFDIASTCRVNADGQTRPGLLLVEAKAYEGELREAENGKRLRADASEGEVRNHDRIGAAIDEASSALTTATGLTWALSRDSRYQMSNRFAWAWKLTQLGVPVILVYLGFTQAKEMTDRGALLANADDWRRLVQAHSKPLFPDAVWNKKHNLHDRAFIPLIRSTEVGHDAPVQNMVVA